MLVELVEQPHLLFCKAIKYKFLIIRTGGFINLVRSLRNAMDVTRAIRRIWVNRVVKYTPDFWSQLRTITSGFYTLPKTV